MTAGLRLLGREQAGVVASRGRSEVFKAQGILQKRSHTVTLERKSGELRPEGKGKSSLFSGQYISL